MNQLIFLIIFGILLFPSISGSEEKGKDAERIVITAEEIKEMIMGKVNAAVIQQKSVEQGMIPLVERGIMKVLEGLTTIEEILRVAKE